MNFKKALSLVLALAMALSLGAVAFAYNTDLIDKEDAPDAAAVKNINQDTLWVYEKNSKWFAYDWAQFGKEDDEIPFVTFNQTYYFDPVDKDGDIIWADLDNMKSASGIKVTAQWDEGGDYIDSVSMERVDQMWAIKLATKGNSTDPVDVAGRIYLKGTTGSGDNKEKINGYFTVDLTLEYLEWDIEEADKEIYVWNMPFNWPVLVDFEDSNRDDMEINFIEFGGNDEDLTVETDVSSSKKILLGYNRDEIEEVAAAYPAADLDFYNTTGRFRKDSTVTLYADEGTFLYKYEDGKLAKIDAEYDEFDEAFVFTTKKLASYIVSNVELDTSALNTATVAPVDGAAATNPSTGAAL